MRELKCKRKGCPKSDVTVLEENERETESAVRTATGAEGADASAQAEEADLQLMVPSPLWETLPLKDAERVIEYLLAEIDRGKKVIRDRAAAAQKVNLYCFNPNCLRPLASIRSAVSAWTVRDPKLGIEQTMYACSDSCHRLIHRNIRPSTRTLPA